MFSAVRKEAYPVLTSFKMEGRGVVEHCHLDGATKSLAKAFCADPYRMLQSLGPFVELLEAM
eukprot:6468421-Alexandrium_andersonii.AAC.1